ncbi:MAG: hypothetical protein LDLANPLL_01955 [Turneriella sp.]|nr:hypothetical protein [Turneriella sp.]
MANSSFVPKTVSRLSSKKLVRLQINALTKQGRKDLRDVILEFFEKENLDKQHVLPIHYAIVELVFNALKANVKFAAFREEVRKELGRFESTTIDNLLQIVISERALREFAATRILPKLLRDQVQKIFDIEEKYRAGMSEKLNEAQIELLIKFRNLIRSLNADVTLTISANSEEVRIVVLNTVPMLQRDLERIHDSRMRHAKLHKEGRGGEFFSYENMDTTESAGFGIAMVDQGFYKMGIDPFEHLKIDAKNAETLVTLVYPRSALSKTE